MGFYKQLRTVVLTLSALGFATTAVMPLPVGAVSFPDSAPSGSGEQPRTASGAPRRDVGGCLPTLGDSDGDGNADLTLSPMTVIAPVGNGVASLDSQVTLWIYTPKTQADIAEVEVQQVAASGKAQTVFRAEIDVPATLKDGSRIVAYPLAAFTPEAGASYTWQLSLICRSRFATAEQLPPGGMVSGTIDCTFGCRLNAQVPDPKRLSTAQVIQTAQSYAAQRFWDETVQLVASIRRAQPEQWRELLASQGLACLANVPFATEENLEFTIADDPQCFLKE